MFKKVGYKPREKWPLVMTFGVLYTATIAAYVSPLQAGAVTNFGILTSISNGVYVHNFVRYFMWSSVVGGGAICCMVFVCQIYCKTRRYAAYE